MVREVHASHILVRSEEKAKELAKKIQSGESFEELAKTNSVCPSGKQCGDLGWFRRGMMVPEFEKAAFEGKKGSVVGPIKTQFGWHLIKIIDTR